MKKLRWMRSTPSMREATKMQMIETLLDLGKCGKEQTLDMKQTDLGS